MNQAATLCKIAKSYGGLTAVSLGERPVQSYAELALRAARLAGGLGQRFQLSPGDRVAIAMKNCPEYLEVLYGIWHGGQVAVPINAKLHGNEFAYILENSGAKLCIVTPDLAEALAELPGRLPSLKAVIDCGGQDYRRLFEGDAAALASVQPTDLGWLFYTSGTTGRPKGAMLSHRNLVAMTMSYYADVDSVAPGDCMIHCAPMSHGSGLYALPHVAKAANNVIPESGGYEPPEALALLARWPKTTFFFAPTMITRLINAPALRGADTSHLKTIVYGGAPMYVQDMLQALDALGPKFVQIFGQGESPMQITYLPKAMLADRAHPHFAERLASAGIARTDVEVRVCDAEDRDLPLGQPGEVLVRGDVVMAGYWDNAKATAETLRGGWLHTGDVGSLDAEGFLTLMDRSTDMIISGGTNIYPREIEEVLIRHPAVLECSVVGRPHADWGEEVVAFVVARPGQTVTSVELDRLCLEQIARFKRPKDYKVVEALPKNNYGKILKTELRQRLQDEAGRRVFNVQSAPGAAD